jgi:hypothetical protein
MFTSPREAHWLTEYLHELTTFPKSKYDDQTDSTSQALAWLKQRMPCYGIFEYYRQLYEESKSRELPRHRLEVTNNCSHVSTITGRQITVPNDRIITVTDEEMPSLLWAGFRKVS